MKHHLLPSCGCPKYYIYKAFNKRFIEYNTNRIVTSSEQRKRYKTLLTDESGWLSFITSKGYLFHAGLLASDIANSYLHNGLRVIWLNTFDIKRQDQQDALLRADLIVFDALFYDGARMNRDNLYSTISRLCQSENTSVIVIGQAPSPKSFINYLGLKPNYIFQV